MVIWFPMVRESGYFQPRLNLRIAHGVSSTSAKFIVDTGAVVSLAPRYLAVSLVDDAYERPTKPIPHVTGVGGSAVVAFPLDVELHVPELGAVQETVWFYEGSGRHALLGSHRWFEQVGAKIENWPQPAPPSWPATSEGRRFGLHYRYRY